MLTHFNVLFYNDDGALAIRLFAVELRTYRCFFFFMGAFSFLPDSKESGVRDEESAGGAAAAYIHREDTRALSY